MAIPEALAGGHARINCGADGRVDGAARDTNLGVRTLRELGLTPRRANHHSPVGRLLDACRVEVGLEGGSMLILGLVLLILGYLTNIGFLVTLGIILLVIGAVLWILGSMGRPVGGRRHYW
jgi:hypothetical protein